MAKFEKGNKLGGRKVGALNKSTEMMKLTIARAVNNTLDTIQADLTAIKKRDPVKAMELALKLMEYTMPKMRSIDMNGTIDVNAKIQQKSVNIIKGTDERTEN